MLTDVAFRVGQTLTHAVTLPTGTSHDSYCTAEKTSLGQRLAWCFDLPMQLARAINEHRRQVQLDQELAMLPDTVLNDLGVNRHQLRQRNELQSNYR